MGSVVFFWVGTIFGAFLGGFVDRFRHKTPTIRIDPTWQELPSGWSRDVHGLTVYAMTQGGAAYWWVARKGKTVIEGPADTLDMAKIEAEREAKSLSL